MPPLESNLKYSAKSDSKLFCDVLQSVEAGNLVVMLFQWNCSLISLFLNKSTGLNHGQPAYDCQKKWRNPPENVSEHKMWCKWLEIVGENQGRDLNPTSWDYSFQNPPANSPPNSAGDSGSYSSRTILFWSLLGDTCATHVWRGSQSPTVAGNNSSLPAHVKQISVIVFHSCACREILELKKDIAHL